MEISKELRKLENKLVGLELSNRNLESQISRLAKFLNQQGHTKEKIKQIAEDDESDNLNTKVRKDEHSR